jgi:hypothetical protein
MRLWSLFLAFSALFLSIRVSPCFAQQATVAEKPDEAQAHGRLQGTLVRPQGGVQHPDLDKAWSEYDKQMQAVAEAIERAIDKEFNAAVEAGDLDAALKWKTAGERFQKEGRIPEGLDDENAKGKPKSKPQKPEVSPQSQIVEAQKQLATAYEAVEKGLVRSRELEKAKQVRAESVAGFGQPNSPHKRFLANLAERGFNTGPQKSFTKNGSTPEGQPITVRGIRAPHALWLHPPTQGFSQVTFDVPEGASWIVGTVAMNDSTQDQRTPLTFAILDERENTLWSSGPIKGRGAEQTFDVPLGETKAITLKVVCPGDWSFAHAVWVDPYFRLQ